MVHLRHTVDELTDSITLLKHASLIARRDHRCVYYTAVMACVLIQYTQNATSLLGVHIMKHTSLELCTYFFTSFIYSHMQLYT
jgi:hypothetical protein